jgi:hypothetical protein
MRANSFPFKLIDLLISAGLMFIYLSRNVRTQFPASTTVVRKALILFKHLTPLPTIGGRSHAADSR